MAVDILTEFESVVAALERDGISYAVCGGLAVTIHGHVRATRDIDLLCPLDMLQPLLDSLERVGFTMRAGPIPFGVGTPARRELYRASRIVDGEVFTVDVLLVTPVLADAWEGRERIEWHGHHVPTVSRSGLMAMKRLAGRLQDLADIEALEGGRGE